MIDCEHSLPITKQASALGLARSTAYSQPVPISHGELALMRRIDELHRKYPFAGVRMMRDLLRFDGHQVGTGHPRRLM